MGMMDASNGEAESVDAFLERVASLKGRSETADVESRKKLEHDILQGRRERVARRLERARSLSPKKDPQFATSSPRLQNYHPAPSPRLDPSPRLEFSPRLPTEPIALSPSPSPPKAMDISPTRTMEPPSQSTFSRPLPPSPTKSSGLGRSNTLSWQQRPTGTTGESTGFRNRPLSQDTKAQTPTVNDFTPSRDEIAQSLRAKDSSWFRQTQDRGAHSSAYRKTREEDYDGGDRGSLRLHGMAPEIDRPTEKFVSTPAEQKFGSSPGTSPAHPIRNSAGPKSSPYASSDHAPPRSPSPIKNSPERSSTLSLRLDSVSLDQPTSQLQDRPPSPERPFPPTKGLGGFVQSAMMKRSDSVNKRWSVQAAPGLTRANSVATGRSNHAHSVSNSARSSFVLPEAQKTVQPLSSPTLAASGPSSSPTRQEFQRPQTPLQAGRSFNLTRPDHRLPVADATSPTATSHEEVRPSSPSKTSDPRRWSPTKASWLESALTRPDSPKPSAPKSSTPTWMSDLQRSNSIRRDTAIAPKTVSVETKLPPVTESSQSRKADKLPGPVEEKQISDQKEPKIEKIVERPAKVGPPPTTKLVSSSPEIDAKVEAYAKAELQVNQKTTSTLKESRSPPLLKPKPESPKIDFRSNLKPKKESGRGVAEEEAEFKNVFGKLRRTETKNYVAPDVFKNNILRGKAALSLTGGPQKTERVDEFKESILKKKEAMRVGSQNPPPTSDSGKPKAEAKKIAVPEALAKRNALHKGTFTSKISLEDPFSTSTSIPVTNAEKSPQRTPLSVLDHGSPRNQPLKETVAKCGSNEHMSQGRETVTAKQEDLPKERVSQATFMTKSAQAGGKLAHRLNPNLASMITRGPSPLPNKEVAASSGNTRSSAAAHTKDQDPAPTGGLTHMTKNRARGPKRRLPKGEPESKAKPSDPVRAASVTSPATAEVTAAKDAGPSIPASLLKSQSVKPTARVPSRTIHSGDDTQSQAPAQKPVTSPKPAEFSASRLASGQSKKLAESKVEDEKTRPIVASKSPTLRKISSPKSVDGVKTATVGHSNGEVSSLSSTAASGRELPPNVKSMIKNGGRDLDTAGTTPKASGGHDMSTPKASRSPEIPANSKFTRPITEKPSGWPKAGLGLGLKLSPSKTVSQPSQLTPPLDTAVNPQSDSDCASFMTGFFGELPRVAEKGEIDVQSLIVDKAESDDRLKVANVKVWQINSDGKKEALSPERQHILFDDSIYLCVGHFSTAAGGSNSFAYLWSGDGVNEAATEDAQLFARREARTVQARLELLGQGKEHANFFKALGGIVITRSSRRSDFALSGRRHLGHVAFDEVDLETTSLCSAFVYIVACSDKLYLWKGGESGPDEVGCARLISMDLGLNSEIQEVDQGREPPAFERIVKGIAGRQPSNSPKLGSPSRVSRPPFRLFRIERERNKGLAGLWGRRSTSPSKDGKAVAQEIRPFTQGDLDPQSVYIVDSISTIFIYVGDGAKLKSAEFVTALTFAEQYGMLAASLQDRPAIPPCFVSFGEFPAAFTAAFRKWKTWGVSNAPLKMTRLFNLNDVMTELDRER